MKIIAVALALALALSLATAAGAIPVANPGFETGNFSGWTTFRPGVTPPATNIAVTNIAPHSGSFSARFGDFDNGSGIEQSLATIAGQTYTVSFWWSLDAGVAIPTDAFAAIKFGGTTLYSQAGDPNNGSGFTWTQFIGSATATGPTTTLSFFFENLPGYWHLDDVAVSLVPEPAAWTLMIAGFGMVGALARQRRDPVTA